MIKQLLLLLALFIFSILLGAIHGHFRDIPFWSKQDNEVELLLQNQLTSQLNKNIPVIKYQQMKAIVSQATHIIIDAREKDLYEKGNIEGSYHLPFMEKETHLPEFLQMFPQETPLAIYCSGLKCSSAVELANHLATLNYTNISVYLEGWDEWSSIKN